MRTTDMQSPQSPHQPPHDGDGTTGYSGMAASPGRRLTMIDRLKGGLGAEALKFLVVGVAAAGVHFLVATLLIEIWGWEGWQANAVGFFSGFPVSYLGHAHITFAAGNYKRERATTGRSFWRFAATVVFCFLLSQASVYLFVDVLSLPHRFVLIGTIAGAAVVSYLLNKFWSFRG